MDFKEDFLHSVWKYQYFDKNGLQTTSGEPLTIRKIGFHNFHEGPDFLEAHIQLGEVAYFGHVEVHRKSSDWKNHDHDADPRYNSVVLHVVYEDDKAILRKDGTLIPTLVLKGRILLDVVRNYERLIAGKGDLLCNNGLQNVPEIIRFSALEKALVERLEIKSSRVLKILEETNSDWEETCFRWLLIGFGFKTNAEAMERLGKLLDFKTLKKHSSNPLVIQALLLGQAGLIPERPEDEYGKILKREHDFYQQKYTWPIPMHVAEWKFMGVRPANFPTIRLVQLAEVIRKNPNLLGSLLHDSADFKALKRLFSIQVPEYWRHHHQVDKTAVKPMSSALSSMTFNLLLINFVVPIWFAYGKYLQDSTLQERCFDLLQAMNAEENYIIRKFRNSDWIPQNAFDAQGMLGMYHNYCHQKRCLDCKVGQNLLKPALK
ncbi:DUF2851 family protein [Belliella pelovolcani]|uniref:DUF2851 domain-containing protein n=1 Tax=Belliella pelovolcani TaxID=529505 RepID=A0A1N7JI01_9BACT|nr:DUF2851 family protein [Belliella pelovolcani]SIS48881.1 Protein of unknown function [Belliella pelovolcani]